VRAMSSLPEPTRPTSPALWDEVWSLREQLTQAHLVVEQTLTELIPELGHCRFPEWAHLVGLYAHAVCVEDATITALLQGGAPLFATAWAHQVTWSPPPPPSERGHQAWASHVLAELAAVRQYAAAVYAATDGYVAALSPEALGRTVELSSLGLGQPTVAWLLSRFVLGELARLCRELSVVKSRAGGPASAAC